MREIRVSAPAKLNLYLDVLDKRSDGYHDIKTLFEKIDLQDEIVIREKTKKGLSVKVEPMGACPSGEQNIVYKALSALLKASRSDVGLEVMIKKRIPVAAGLGGGSSDAASAIRAVNDSFDLGLSKKELFSIAIEAGKDVPFFMLDESFAIASKTGECLEPLEIGEKLFHIIIKPRISVSTAEMYKRIDDGDLKMQNGGIDKIVLALKKNEIDGIRKHCYNIFELVLADYSPYIEKAKTLLEDAGAGQCLLSGSGPSVFCVLNDGKEAQEILKRIPKKQNMDIFFATTYA
jgi:4-diphosphocytidyl-2-C-methyl-D-erythritol kinase